MIRTNDRYYWIFDFNRGQQYHEHESWSNGSALAVRDGDVPAVVPIPGAIWLLGSDIIGMIGVRRKFQG